MLSTLLNTFIHIKAVNVIEFLGTIAFAISGIRLASAKSIDWFGAILIGFVTAIGGGTLRDIMLNLTPFWMNSTVYLWGTLLAFVVVVFFRRYLVHFKSTIFLFDSIGLGLFVVVGFSKTMMMGFEPWVCVFMGMITGIVGGMTRDILINEVPLVFSQEFYALACIIGGIIYAVLNKLHVESTLTQIVTAVVVLVIRILATKYHWVLPTLKQED